MEKRILIFGGGENQSSLINASKALGVESIVIDPNEDAPGKVLADHFEIVGPLDYDLTKKIALKYKVDGIVTSQMENPLILMAKLADELGFIFPPVNVITQCRNKYLMKQVFLKYGIPCAKGIRFGIDEKIDLDKLKDSTFPLIIKPVDSHSSRGVYKINNYEEIIAFEKLTRSFSSDKSLLLEEFIEGNEYSVESLTFKGKTDIIQITEKIITPYPYTVELGHLQPAELTANEKTEVRNLVVQAIMVLGIENSAAHTEIKLTSDGFVIIEIGARLGGDYISSYLTLASTGVDMDKGAINIALGNKPDVTNKTNKFSYIKYLELPTGSLVSAVKNWDSLKNSEDMVFASISVKEGQIIPSITDSSKRSGFVIVQGESKSKVINTANEKAKLLTGCIKMN